VHKPHHHAKGADLRGGLEEHPAIKYLPQLLISHRAGVEQFNVEQCRENVSAKQKLTSMSPLPMLLLLLLYPAEGIVAAISRPIAK